MRRALLWLRCIIKGHRWRYSRRITAMFHPATERHLCERCGHIRKAP